MTNSIDTEFEIIERLISGGYYFEAEQKLNALSISTVGVTDSCRYQAHLLQLYYHTSRVAEAMELSSILLNSTYVSTSDFVKIAIIALKLGSDPKPITSMSERSDISPAERALISGLQNLNYSNYEFALECFRKGAASLNETTKSYSNLHVVHTLVALNRLPEAIIELDKLLFSNASIERIAPYAMKIFLSNSQLDAAGSIAKRIAEQEVLTPRDSASLIEYYFITNQWHDASIHAINVLLSDMWNETALFVYGVAAAECGSFEESESVLLQLISSQRFGKQACHALALIYRKQKKVYKRFMFGIQVGAMRWKESASLSKQDAPI